MKISIIGAGWVGLPLAQVLIAKGHLVQVSKSSDGNVAQLLQHGIDAKKVKLSQGGIVETDLDNLTELGQSDVVVITIPPGFRSGEGDYYAEHIQAICQHISADVKQVILISSTAVYPEIDKDMLEQDASAWNDKAEKILAAEHVVRSLFPKQYLIVRFSGLFGAERHPARFVKHMRSVSNVSYANMLHQNDAVHGLAFLIKQQITQEVINLSTPEKMDKASFYQAAINNYQGSDTLLLPEQTSTGSKKFVLSNKIVHLGYQFKFNQLQVALKHC